MKARTVNSSPGQLKTELETKFKKGTQILLEYFHSRGIRKTEYPGNIIASFHALLSELVDLHNHRLPSLDINLPDKAITTIFRVIDEVKIDGHSYFEIHMLQNFQIEIQVDRGIYNLYSQYTRDSDPDFNSSNSSSTSSSSGSTTQCLVAKPLALSCSTTTQLKLQLSKPKQDHFLLLPYEVILIIFSFLKPEDLITINLVNRLFRAAASDPIIWGNILQAAGFKPGVKVPLDLKKDYYLQKPFEPKIKITASNVEHGIKITVNARITDSVDVLRTTLVKKAYPNEVEVIKSYGFKMFLSGVDLAKGDVEKTLAQVGLKEGSDITMGWNFSVPYGLI